MTVTDNITEVLDFIAQMNINKCAATTYDLSVQECARQEIIQGLAQHYNVTYNITPKNVTVFPVKGTRA
jgi:hypothetical protein